MRTYICTNFEDYGDGANVAVIVARDEKHAEQLLINKLCERHGAAGFFPRPDVWELTGTFEGGGTCELVNGGDCD